MPPSAPSSARVLPTGPMAPERQVVFPRGVWFRRGRLFMVSPDSQAIACPLSGRNSTYRPVQISGAGSDIVVYTALQIRN